MNEDSLAKVGLQVLLKPFVPLAVQQEVQGPAQFADVFISGPPVSTEALVRSLGLLGRMASQPTLLEAFSDTMTLAEARDCQRKQLTLHHMRALDTKAPLDFPWLWVVSLGKPRAVIDGWRLHESDDWPRGVYRSADAMAVGVVVLRELPAGPETATLRLFGDERIRKKLAAELTGMSRDDPKWQAIQALKERWTILLLGTPEDEARRRMMNFLEFEQIVERESTRLRAEGALVGEVRGEVKGERKALTRVLARRGLALTDAQQSQIADCAELATLERWLDQAITAASADEALR